jgi:hypothetical protein
MGRLMATETRAKIGTKQRDVAQDFDGRPEDVRNAISTALKGLVITSEHRKKIGQANSRPRLSLAERAQRDRAIVELRDAGLTFKQIAERVGGIKGHRATQIYWLLKEGRKAG